MKTIYDLFPECTVTGLSHLEIIEQKNGIVEMQLYRKCNGLDVNYLSVYNTITESCKNIDINNKTIYFISSEINQDDRPNSVEQAEKLAKEGKTYCVTGKEIYKAYYQMDPEAYSIFDNGYSLRTKAYLDRVKSNIGLISYTHASESYYDNEDGSMTKKLEDFRRYERLASDYSDIEVGKNNGHWIAQYSHQAGVDGYAVVKFIFNKCPTENDVITAYYIQQTEEYFRSAMFKKTRWRTDDNPEEFYCWNCGKKSHWLDIPGSLDEKFSRLKDKNCGCF